MSATLLYLRGDEALRDQDNLVDALLKGVVEIQDVRDRVEDVVVQHARDKNLARLKKILPNLIREDGRRIRYVVDLFGLTPGEIGLLPDIGPKRLKLILSWITSLGLPEPGPQNGALIAAARNKLTTLP